MCERERERDCCIVLIDRETTQLLVLLVSSLALDNECFKIWEERYVHFVAQSNNLLLYICLDWDSLSSQVLVTPLLHRVRTRALCYTLYHSHVHSLVLACKSIRTLVYRSNLVAKINGITVGAICDLHQQAAGCRQVQDPLAKELRTYHPHLPFDSCTLSTQAYCLIPFSSATAERAAEATATTRRPEDVYYHVQRADQAHQQGRHPPNGSHLARDPGSRGQRLCLHGVRGRWVSACLVLTIRLLLV